MPPFFDQSHLHALIVSLARTCTWLILLFAIFAPLERLFALHKKKATGRSPTSDLGYYFINSLVPGLLLAVPLSLAAWGAHYLIPYRVQVTVAAWPLWRRIVVGFVVGEIGCYWGHRWCHQIPFLWRFHSIHHEPEHIYFLISSRAHPIDNAFIRLCGLIPACVLGVASPLTPSGGVVAALIIVVATLWGFFIHANVNWRLGPLEWVIATPRFHHWHHTRNDHRDHNYASMLPVMDWIFRSAHLPRTQWPLAYGIVNRIPSTLGAQLVYPFLPQPRHITSPEQATRS